MNIRNPWGKVEEHKPTAYSRSQLYKSLVEDASDLVAAIDADFTIAYASPRLTSLLDRSPADVEGESVADYLHPDDLDRALLQMGGWSNHGSPSGTAGFRLMHADGQWVPVDMTAAQVNDGHRDLLAVYCRPVDYQQATDQVLARLLSGADRADALAPVLDVFSWAENDAHVAITWFEEGIGHRYVSTGLPAELAGASELAGIAWTSAREKGEDILDIDQSTLEPHLADLAAEYGRGSFWVVPVDDAAGPIPALVTVWTRADGPRPDGHAYGMDIAKAYIELILRWSNQISSLERAANHDPLTGLENRNALFAILDTRATPGALLYADLNGLKPINDRYGHTAGDEVLRQVARRIEGCVSGAETVARVGGDEFAILAPDADEAAASALADKISSAVDQAISINGGDVRVGLTVGIAHDADGVTESTLAEADRALIEAKAARKQA